jgi:hypothetical protein
MITLVWKRCISEREANSHTRETRPNRTRSMSERCLNISVTTSRGKSIIFSSFWCDFDLCFFLSRRSESDSCRFLFFSLILCSESTRRYRERLTVIKRQLRRVTGNEQKWKWRQKTHSNRALEPAPTPEDRINIYYIHLQRTWLNYCAWIKLVLPLESNPTTMKPKSSKNRADYKAIQSGDHGMNVLF